mmetsp:Transcript_19570/g.46277  ORF Transcript_19570/g.46277 Transcript_19570/m.46277 type:complete len:209 (+) Transcript_19570:311-937(+)
MPCKRPGRKAKGLAFGAPPSSSPLFSSFPSLGAPSSPGAAAIPLFMIPFRNAFKPSGTTFSFAPASLAPPASGSAAASSRTSSISASASGASSPKPSAALLTAPAAAAPPKRAGLMGCAIPGLFKTLLMKALKPSGTRGMLSFAPGLLAAPSSTLASTSLLGPSTPAASAAGASLPPPAPGACCCWAGTAPAFTTWTCASTPGGRPGI